MPSLADTPNASVQPSSRVFGCKPPTHTPISTFTVICVHCNSVCVKSSFGMRNRQHVCKRHVDPLCVGGKPSVLVAGVNVLGTNTHDASVLVNAAHINTEYMPKVRATTNKVTETGNVHFTFLRTRLPRRRETDPTATRRLPSLQGQLLFCDTPHGHSTVP